MALRCFLQGAENPWLPGGRLGVVLRPAGGWMAHTVTATTTLSLASPPRTRVPNLSVEGVRSSGGAPQNCNLLEFDAVLLGRGPPVFLGF